MEISEPLHMWLTLLVVTLLKLSGEPFLDSLGACPCLKLLAVGLIPELEVRQCSKGILKLGQKIVWIPGGENGCGRSLRDRAMWHRGPSLSGKAQSIAPLG
jgi:hypothetical protein